MCKVDINCYITLNSYYNDFLFIIILYTNYIINLITPNSEPPPPIKVKKQSQNILRCAKLNLITKLLRLFLDKFDLNNDQLKPKYLSCYCSSP